ncbi:DUF4439 domain-containing protein [Arthrobacter sp. EPSL27]|uniref:DUF4439 domain-containing protein n=1 Tax=Arthrobacter sp. EPSL27 TaxID=1745378 RepID=UPI0009E87AD0|nr:DUF4439 domain-containing protein [Arthrobacter sp. EPSL27]
MKDDTRQKRRQELIPRIALLSCIALVVVSLGMVLSPGRPQKPVEPPFSEQARAAALTDTMRLRAAGEELSRGAAGTGQPAVGRTVSLLTTQARALQVPADGAGTPPAATASAATPATTATSTAAPLPATVPALAGALADSAGQRFADAAVADGGMARLLAAVGTAQLLQASALAAAAGVPAPAVPDPTAPPLSGECPGTAAAAPSSSPAATPAATAGAASSEPASADSPAATLPGALAAAVRAERETVYGYQVALTRLAGDAAASASQQLARHEDLVAGAEELSRAQCAPVPPREAGYAVAPGFLAAPAAGLGTLEASGLAVYGDLVALGEGQTREWAISGLVGAARRSVLWGADPGALPGLTADPEAFPTLPPSPTPSP